MKSKNPIYWLNELCTLFGSFLFVLMVVITFTQVVARYCFNSAFDWPEEASRFLFIWVAYLATAYGMFCKCHLKVDFLYMVVGRRITWILEILAHVVSMGFMFFIAWQGWEMLGVVIESEEVALTLPVPLWIVWFSIPFCFAITGINCIYNVFTQKMKTGDEA